MAAAQTDPVPQLRMAAVVDVPTPPWGTYAVCLQESNSPVRSAWCPVIDWGDITYWPLTYVDNRLALCLVAFEAEGRYSSTWELQGARFVVNATVEAATRQIRFTGQGGSTVSVAWDAIATQPAPRRQPFWIANTGTGTALTAPPQSGPVRLSALAEVEEQLWVVDPLGHTIAAEPGGGKLALEGFATNGATLSVAPVNPQAPGQRCTIDAHGRLVALAGGLAATASAGAATVTLAPTAEPPSALQQWRVRPLPDPPDVASDQLPQLLPGQPFALALDAAPPPLLLTAPTTPGGAVTLAAAEAVEPGLATWGYQPEGAMVVNAQRGLALTVSGTSLIALAPSRAPGQQWVLTAEGLFACPALGLLLTVLGGRLMLTRFDPLQPAAGWLLRPPRALAAIRDRVEVGEEPAPLQNITRLTLTAKVANESFAGTTDTIYVSVGWRNAKELLFDEPSAGASATIDVDLRAMFGRPAVNIADLDHITIYQQPSPHPLISDAWKLASLSLIANDAYANSFERIDRWLNCRTGAAEAVWSRPIPPGAWIDASQRPVDFGCQTYSVRLQPWIGDMRSWRSYDPSTIEGVGQLLGMNDGRLIGEQLKTRQCEELQPTDATHTYTWVYTPDGSIIYKWWDRNDRDAYIRHSQLGSGQPVICAGEMEIHQVVKDQGVATVIGMINDASGHYKPDGGSCLWNLARKLQQLGIPTDAIAWYWRDNS